MSSSREETLPVWARTLGAQGYRTFIALVEGYFAAKNIAIQLDPEEGVVRPSPGILEQSSVFGLQNIAQSCSQADRDRWHELIHAHFDTVFGQATEQTEQNALTMDVSNFGHIRTQLRARLYPVDLLSQSVEAVHRPGPDGTVEVLVLDLPRSVRTVARSEANAWPTDDDELFAIGRANLTQTGKLTDNTVPVQPGVDLHLYTGDAFYAGSHALILQTYLPADLPHGVLVGFPKRDVLLAHHIHNIGVTEAIGAMLQAILGMYRDGPGSLSPNLYWFRNGEFTLLPYQLHEESLDFSPPDAFVDMLNELADRANLT